MVKGENAMSKSARSLFKIKTTLAMLSMQSSVDYYLLADDSAIRDYYENGADFDTILNYVNENY
jgi:hypothetical protein